jgi:hypothetical protein
VCDKPIQKEYTVVRIPRRAPAFLPSGRQIENIMGSA